MTGPLLYVITELFPVLIVAIVIVVLGNAWWDNKGKEHAQELLKQPGLLWLFPGLPILMITFLVLGYVLSHTLPWWYVISAFLGSVACMVFLKIIVVSSSSEGFTISPFLPWPNVLKSSNLRLPHSRSLWQFIRAFFYSSDLQSSSVTSSSANTLRREGETSEYHNEAHIVELISDTFPVLSEELVLEVSHSAQSLHFSEGTTVLQEGETADHFYIIAHGRAVVTRRTWNGLPIPVNELGPGEFFGEIGLLDNTPRVATVEAVTDLEVVALEGDMLSKILDSSEETASELNRVKQERKRRL